ncbi:MAG: hypothetical protein AAFX39_16165 [Pseudomonadota bacterium]
MAFTRGPVANRLHSVVYAVATAVVLAGVPTPASATTSISCEAVDGSGTTLDVLLGAGPRLSPIAVRFASHGSTWSTVEGEADTDIVIFQAFDDGTLLAVDVTDPNVLDVVAEIRLVRAEEMKSFAQGGTLRVVGVGTHLVSCEGP